MQNYPLLQYRNNGKWSDFGDLIEPRSTAGTASSDSHGGLDKYVRSISICQTNHR